MPLVEETILRRLHAGEHDDSDDTEGSSSSPGASASLTGGVVVDTGGPELGGDLQRQPGNSGRQRGAASGGSGGGRIRNSAGYGMRSSLSDALDMFSQVNLRNADARFSDYMEQASQRDLYERLGGRESDSPDSRETIMLILRNYNRYGSSLEALHGIERASKERERSRRIPSMPVHASSWLVPGMRFVGRRELSFTPPLDDDCNRVNDESVNFQVTIEDVDLDNLTLALSVTRSPPYFYRMVDQEPEKWECVLVDHRRNTLRVTSLHSALLGWRRLKPFRDMKTGDYYTNVHNVSFLQRLQAKYVFMRWFHAPSGAHCLAVLHRLSGTIEGVSYELSQNCDKDQPRYRLSLSPLPLYAVPKLAWA